MFSTFEHPVSLLARSSWSCSFRMISPSMRKASLNSGPTCRAPGTTNLLFLDPITKSAKFTTAAGPQLESRNWQAWNLFCPWSNEHGRLQQLGWLGQSMSITLTVRLECQLCQGARVLPFQPLGVQCTHRLSFSQMERSTRQILCAIQHARVGGDNIMKVELTSEVRTTSRDRMHKLVGREDCSERLQAGCGALHMHSWAFRHEGSWDLNSLCAQGTYHHHLLTKSNRQCCREAKVSH